jgi:hypothetical protein
MCQGPELQNAWLINNTYMDGLPKNFKCKENIPSNASPTATLDKYISNRCHTLSNTEVYLEVEIFNPWHL